MPDITMCLNQACKLAPTCKRSALSGTKSSMIQSVAYFAPDASGKCDDEVRDE